MDNIELLNSPSDSFLPKIPILHFLNSDIYEERKVPSISLQKLNKLIKYMSKDNVLFLQPSDKNREINNLLNETIENKDDSESVDDMSTWFGSEINTHLSLCLLEVL